ncbi:hypothetical protein VSH64_00815 [Amycolatopsis rhabdoformis]|uniref:Lactonase family protein n=1 Tax=Amycolatopsis rhabdoformis TaxID=1448059 RepID=A0ABZ1IAB9_9PSEU|nr:hypothetical protein [Amycolatopsis rhabdoformis]WSE30686.1 hypothetical protein VSH64_00815 [Amycolatopsis rhabdoformis]
MTRHSRERRVSAAVLATMTAAAALALAPAAVADTAQHAVFVQTNDPTANTVVTYTRDGNGGLHEAGRYPTGGRGTTLGGAGPDALSSQGALTYDAGHQLLYAVNGGSDTLTVFAVSGAHLTRLQTLPTGGAVPVSVGFAHDRVYVLDAGGEGAVTGFRVHDRRLTPIPGSTRGLGLGNAPLPDALSAPSQVALTPDGADLVITTKTHNTLQVFPLDAAARPSARPVANPSAGMIPYAVGFDRRGHVLVTEATGSESSYALTAGGRLETLSAAVATGEQGAPCWSVVVGATVYTANTNSDSITAFRIGHDGGLTLTDPSAIAATTDPAPIDLAATGDGRFLYQLSAGAGAVDEYSVARDGSLHRIGSVTGLPVFDGKTGPQGIAAS